MPKIFRKYNKEQVTMALKIVIVEEVLRNVLIEILLINVLLYYCPQI